MFDTYECVTADQQGYCCHRSVKRHLVSHLTGSKRKKVYLCVCVFVCVVYPCVFVGDLVYHGYIKT